VRAGEAFQHEQSEGVDIARRARALTHDLLGAQVGGRAEHRSRLGHPGAVDEPRDAQVSELGADRAAAARDEDVGRLHVPVHDAALVHMRECGRDLCPDRGDLARGEDRQEAAEILALDELHHEVGRLLVAARERIVQRHERGMVDAREHPHLGVDAAGIRGDGDVGAEQLDRDVAAELQVRRAVHDGHATPAEHGAEAVAAAEDAVGDGARAGRHSTSLGLSHGTGEVSATLRSGTTPVLGWFRAAEN
jgi:hypothetical protein